MALTPEDIDRIANLAKLKLRPNEVEKTLAQLNRLFALVEQMQAVPTDGIAPLTHPVEAIQTIALRLRPDEITEPDQRQASQISAPAVSESGLFLVPKVIA